MLLKFKEKIALLSILLFCYNGIAFGLIMNYDDFSGDVPNASIPCLEDTCLEGFSVSDKTLISIPRNIQFNDLKWKGENIQKQLMRTYVTFTKNSNNVDAEFIPNIESIAQALLDNPESMVVVMGHTDSSGDESFNQKLSMKRAEQVKKLLVNMGVDFHRIATIGYGSSRPLTSNGISRNEANNRRVNMIIIPSESFTSPSAVTHIDESGNINELSETVIEREKRHNHDFVYNSRTESRSGTPESPELTMTDDISVRDLKTDISLQRDNREDNDFTGVDYKESTNSRRGDKDTSNDNADIDSLKALHDKFIFLYNKGKYTEADVIIEKALRTARKINIYLNTDSLNALKNIAKISYTLGYVKHAMFFYEQLLKSLLSTEYGDDMNIAVTMYNLGSILRSLKEYEKAIFYYMSASRLLIKSNKYHPFRAIIMDGLADISKMIDNEDMQRSYQKIANAIRQRDPSIDLLESYRFRKCQNLSLDMDICKNLK